MQQCVWDVVVLACISAMELGRRFLKTGSGRGALGHDSDALVSRAINRAVSDFWARLRGFAALGVPRQGWAGVGPAHPILRIIAGSIVCAGPGGYPSEDD